MRHRRDTRGFRIIDRLDAFAAASRHLALGLLRHITPNWSERFAEPKRCRVRVRPGVDDDIPAASRIKADSVRIRGCSVRHIRSAPDPD